MDSQQNNSAIRQPINLEAISNTDEAFTQAQVAQVAKVSVRYIRSLSANLRQKINIRKGIQNIYSCITIDNIFVFTDYYNNQLIIYDADVTDAHYISLPIKPFYITKVDGNTVAVSCTSKTILIINICTGSVTSSIKTSSRCYGIVYDENKLYVVNDNEIDVIDLTDKFKNTIPIPSLNIRDISVFKDTLVCIDNRSIYYCSLDGTLRWQFKNDKFKNLHGVTTDCEGNVYVTDEWANTVFFVSGIGNRFGDILNGRDGLIKPCGIHFDKKENVLLVCNAHVGKSFLFDIKKELE